MRFWTCLTIIPPQLIAALGKEAVWTAQLRHLLFFGFGLLCSIHDPEADFLRFQIFISNNFIFFRSSASSGCGPLRKREAGASG
jgi:hypothetical protein